MSSKSVFASTLMTRTLMTRALMISSVAVLAPLASAQDEPTEFWVESGKAAIAERLAHRPNTNRAKNVILFIGDGMGVSTVTAGRIFDGQSKGMPGEENVLSFDAMPYAGLVKTYNVNAQVSDSAGTASAIVTGVKTNIGMVSVRPETPYNSCDASAGLPSALDHAERAGKATGVVTTARLTHATPASAYAKVSNRDWEDDSTLPQGIAGCTDIAAQFVAYQQGDGIDVAFGGGRRHFLPKTMSDPEYADQTGRRLDGRNLVQEWVQRTNGRFVTNRAGLEALAPGQGPVLGLFEPSHLQFEADRNTGPDGDPSLAQMTAKAIDLLAADEDGFFLMVEAGRIDHAHHGGNAYRALADLQAMDAAVRVAQEKTSEEDTLIIVTADHSHVFTIAGYPARGNDILGVVRGLDENTGHKEEAPSLAGDSKAYTTLGYHNGPGAVRGERANPTDAEVTQPNYRQQALIPRSSETHGGEDVPIYASGPWAHLATGVMEQNVIFYIMDHAAQLTGAKDDADR